MTALPLDLPPPEKGASAEFSARQELERRNRNLDLKIQSPLRGKFEQHDESDLALFKSANEPGLPL